MKFVLEHGSGDELHNPTVEDIASAMEIAKDETEASDIQLKYRTDCHEHTELWIICVFVGPTPGTPMWCVRLCRRGAKTSHYLALNGTTGQDTVTAFMCGCEERMDASCVLAEKQVIVVASMFLKNGDITASGTWVDGATCFPSSV